MHSIRARGLLSWFLEGVSRCAGAYSAALTNFSLAEKEPVTSVIALLPSTHSSGSGPASGPFGPFEDAAIGIVGPVTASC